MIQHEISLLLLARIKDPRLINVSIIQVIVTKDLRQARIFYSVYGDEQKATAAEQGLSSARGFIRKHLADHLGLRVTPELVFKRDLSLIRQEEMERLFKELHSEDDAEE
jgi:ribosome-binding factor A